MFLILFEMFISCEEAKKRGNFGFKPFLYIFLFSVSLQFSQLQICFPHYTGGWVTRAEQGPICSGSGRAPFFAPFSLFSYLLWKHISIFSLRLE